MKNTLFLTRKFLKDDNTLQVINGIMSSSPMELLKILKMRFRLKCRKAGRGVD